MEEVSPFKQRWEGTLEIRQCQEERWKEVRNAK